MMEQSADVGYLTTGEAARRLGVSKPTVRRALCRGALPLAYRTPGGYPRFRAADVAAYARHLSAPPRVIDPRRAASTGVSRVERAAARVDVAAAGCAPRPATPSTDAAPPRDTLVDAAERLRAVLDVSRALTAIDDEAELLALIASSACRGLGYGACTVSVRDDTGAFRCRAAIGFTPEQDRLLRGHTLSAAGFAALRAAASPVGSVLSVPAGHPMQQHLALRTSVLPTPPSVLPTPLSVSAGAWQADSLLFVPLLDLDGEVLGFLHPDDPRDGRRPGPGQLAGLEAFAHLAVVALQVVRGRAAARVRAQRAEAERRQLAGLLQAMTSVRGSLRLDEVLQQIAGALTSAAEFGSAIVYLRDAEDTLHMRAAIGLTSEEDARLRATPVPLRVFQHIMRPEMRVSRSYLFDHRRHPATEELDAALSIPALLPDWQEGQWHPEDALTVPLEDRAGRYIGLVSVDEPRDRGYPDLARIQALELFADHCAIAVEQAALYRDMEALATTDALTGLPNRALLHDRLRASLAAARHEGTPAAPLALLLLDLDRFKWINDTRGHHTGDATLARVADLLRGVVRQTDTVARLGGDEFAILLPGAEAAGATAVARAIRAALDAPLIIEGQALTVGVSVGIALSPTHGAAVEILFRHADVAMYAAKRDGRGHAVYDPAHDGQDAARLALVADLRRAIAAGALAVHYQPKAAIASGRGCGVEALARWPHPDHGLIPPDRFIPLAEQTGLIVPLTAWVLGETLRQCRAWADGGLTVEVAVNLSLCNLRDPALYPTVADLLRRHGVAPARLRLELTESVIMADVEGTQATLARLAALGVRLSIDDFGTGYSSLASLSRLPVDELKIDRSFARRLATEATDQTIVASTIGLGHSLGLSVVAEGIEDAQTWALLHALGCDVGQGYYVARPLPADAAEAWLRRSGEGANGASA